MFAVLISIVLQHVGMHEHINFNTLYGSALDLVLIEDLKFHVHNPLEPPPHHRQKLIIRSKFMALVNLQTHPIPGCRSNAHARSIPLQNHLC